MSTGKDRSAGDVLLCERCGYVLSGLPEQGACPECGKAIAESLPSARRLKFDPASGFGWFAVAWRFARSPMVSFASMVVERKSAAAFRWRSELLVSFLAGILAATLSVLEFARTPKFSPFLASIELLQHVGLTFAIVFVATILLLEVVAFIERLGSRNIGRWHRWRISREVAYCVCAYASVGWLVGAFALLAWTLVHVIQTFSAAGAGPRVDGAFSLLGAPVSFLIGLFGYELLVYIGLRRCKFANAEGAR